MSQDFDIVVVGAGAAGIGAVRTLCGAGHSVLLLEASQRVGGRAWTTAFGGGLDLDLGCGWLHSANRNSWAAIAAADGVEIDDRKPAWGKQYRDLGFTPQEQQDARRALKAWATAMKENPPDSDNAWDAAAGIPGAAKWREYLGQVAAASVGKSLASISVADYMAYLAAETPGDWRLPQGLGRLVAGSLPAHVRVRLATPITRVDLEAGGVALQTPAGTIRSRTVIMTVSSNVLASGDIGLPDALEPWRSAALDLSLGANEKLFLEILDPDGLEVETRVIGNPRTARTGAYYIRPLGMGVVEGFFGGEAAEWIATEGPVEAFALAMDELAHLFGANIRRQLRPLTLSGWRRDRWIQGGYSCAAPGRQEARRMIVQPFDGRIFFAGEATHASDFSTVHGAFDSGVRAAAEASAALSGA